MTDQHRSPCGTAVAAAILIGLIAIAVTVGVISIIIVVRQVVIGLVVILGALA